MTETTTILILLTVHVDGKEAGGSMRKYARDLTKRVLCFFFRCFDSHLNGEYYTDPEDASSWEGIIWKDWLGSRNSLKSSVMILKRRKFIV